ARVAVAENREVVVHPHAVPRPHALMIAVPIGLLLCGAERGLDGLTGSQDLLDVPEGAHRAVGDGEGRRGCLRKGEGAALLHPRPVRSDDLDEARDEVVRLVAPGRGAAGVLLVALAEDISLQRAALAHDSLDLSAHLPLR